MPTALLHGQLVGFFLLFVKFLKKNKRNFRDKLPFVFKYAPTISFTKKKQVTALLTHGWYNLLDFFAISKNSS